MNQPIEPPLRKMEFVPEVERQAFRVLASDVGFMIKWRGRLKPDHFNEPHLQLLFKTVDEYVKKFNELPTLDMIYQHIKGHIGAYENAKQFIDYAYALFQEKDRNDAKAVKHCLMEHMKAVDFDRFVLESARLAADKDYAKIESLLKEMTIRHTDSIPTTAYLSTLEDSVTKRVEIENTKKAAMPTPWVTFNNKHGGGFHPSAVSAFMGPTGSGKSILLVNVGSHALLTGKTVYHFTFELSESKTKARYDVCLTGAGYAERKHNPGAVDRTLDGLKAKMGKLFVIQMSTGTCSANNVRAAINDYVLMGAPKPDVIILDYLTIMMPNNPDDVDMKRDYSKLKAIAEEVRAMAMDMDLPVVTALQSNRGAAGKEKISKEDISDSYAVMFVLDCVLSINQNDAEKAAGRLRLYAAKVRDYDDSYTVPLNVTYTNLRISEDPEVTKTYNEAIAKMSSDALAKRAVAGTHTHLPPAMINPEDAMAGLDMVVGLGRNPVKDRNSNIAPTQAESASAIAWGKGCQPPPIAPAPPIASPVNPTPPPAG